MILAALSLTGCIHLARLPDQGCVPKVKIHREARGATVGVLCSTNVIERMMR